MQLKPRKTRNHGKARWYTDAVDPLTGRRRRQFFTSEADALAHQQALATQPAPRPLHAALDRDIPLAQFAADWCWAQVATGAWSRRGTIQAYREHLTRLCAFPLSPTMPLGAVLVRDLTANHVLALVSGMRRDGFAPRTVQTTQRLVHALLDRAVTRGLLPRHPITTEFFKAELKPLLTVPKAERERVKAFTEAQAKQFLGAAQASRLRDLFVTLLLSGLRIGEALGLQLGDDHVAHQHRGLRIERTLLRGSTVHPVTGPPKGGRTRIVDVSDDLGRLLDQIASARPRLALQHAWRPVPSWVFVTRHGRPLDQAVVAKEFQRVLRRANLAHTGFSPHALRHTFACLHIAAGCNPKWLQQQLGHASISITLDLYAASFALRDAHAANALGAALLGSDLAATRQS
jgi:integrase